MTVGPVIAGIGLALMVRVEPGTTYLTTVFPSMMVFGIGMAITVAPLTAAVLAAVDDRHAGIGSGVNNAVARIAGLLAIAVLPLAAGISSAGSLGGDSFTEGFQKAALIAGALCVAGGIVSWFGISNEAVPEERAGHAEHLTHTCIEGEPREAAPV
jgi:hypothetical protein